MNCTDAAVVDLFRQLPPISLAEVLAAAELQVRTDRKYLLRPQELPGLLAAAGDMLVLDIDGSRAFRYESVYFDTAGLLAYQQAARGRRRRFKVRTRSYLDSGQCALEVKTVGGRDETVKDRLDYPIAERASLNETALAFVAQRIALPDGGRELTPALTTTYLRSTLVDPAKGSRLTIDADLICAHPAGSRAGLDGHLVVESKSAGPPTAMDRLLWRQGIRPARISKYCVGLAALDPTLPANRWNRTLRRYFDWQPRRTAVHRG